MWNMTRGTEVIGDVVKRIARVDPAAKQVARGRLDSLTKPIGSLGRLEEIAAQLFALRGAAPELPMKKAVYIFAADHGITAEGVSGYPSEVTYQMVRNFLAGGAAINVLARAHGVAVHVVDVGVDAEFGDAPGLLHVKVRRGSRNMLHEPAMTAAERIAAMTAGMTLADKAHADGVTLLAVGEMGIGNTAAASAITAALTDQPAAMVTGRGTGLNDEAHRRKIRVVEAVLARHRAEDQASEPLEVLRGVGGLEIAAMTGMMLGAASHRIAIVADGFISTAAAAVACGVAPAVRDYLLAGHRSEEPGHGILLRHLALNPILDLGMRLGEGSGAVLAMPVIESAIRLYAEMATFSSAGVSEASA